MRHKSKVRYISVLEIQRLPAEKIVQLLDEMNDGKVILLSIYRSRMEQIGCNSLQLHSFTKRMQRTVVGAMTQMMRKLSRRWHNENTKRIPAEEKRLDKKELSSAAPPGFHSAKMLRVDFSATRRRTGSRISQKSDIFKKDEADG